MKRLTCDVSAVSDAGNAGLPCVSSPGTPLRLAHHALNAIIRNVFAIHIYITLLFLLEQ